MRKELLPVSSMNGTVTTPSESTEGLVSLTVHLTKIGSDFDDSDLRVGITLEVSFDNGVKWNPFVHAEIVGGSRTKNGLLPFVGLFDGTGLGDALVRAVIRSDKTASLGLDIETK